MGMYVIEGADGSGKTTILRNVEKRLQAMFGIDQVVTCRFPGDTQLGLNIRQLLLHDQREMQTPLTPQAQAMFMLADMHLTTHTKIIPAVVKDKIVLCDRYFLSTFVYQFLSVKNYGTDEAARINQDSFFNVGGMFRFLMQPKYTFVIRAAKEIVEARLKERNKDFFENDWEVRWEIYNDLPNILSPRFKIEANIHFMEKENNCENDIEELSAQIANSIYMDCNPGRFTKATS